MIGSAIGGFRILKELGTGGMGTVYLAENGEGSKRAIKIVHPHLIATAGFFKRFLREAELGRKVEHPNVVRTLDVDATMVDDKQVNYMIMEYVEGKSLRDLLLELRTIPETLLREVALQTAAGLAAIHERDIVHRDLKPENVLITDDNEVRIMDLGVAKLQEASIAITQEGQFAGSVLYAAPESFRSGDVGPAADQYSLGVMLYELATGENPFRRDDAAQVIQAHLEHQPPRIDERSSEVSSFLAEITATLLAKKTGERFDSAAVLRDVLTEAETSAWWKERARTITRRDAHLPKIRVHRETALHGRADDLAALEAAWKRALEGQGNTVLVEGEAGIGKTRLVDAFVREVADAHVLYGSYPPSGGLGGLSDAIVGKFGGGDLADAVRPYLPETPTLVPTFAALIKHETPPTGAEPMQGDALHAVCVQLMRSLAAERPTVWIVDDLQFADKESRDLVLSLARATEGHRVLLLVAARPGLPEEELAHLTRLGNVKRLGLGRLSPREILDLLADAFKSESLAEKLGGKIALKSDGVPFFVFEMIRGLKEGQFLQQSADGSYVQTQMITDIEVPSAVKDLIDGRMKGLSEGQRAILDVGSVQGMTFDPGLVAAVLEEKKIRILRDIAEIERRFGLVRGEDRHIRFDQNQIQEVLYSTLIPDLRREYHSLLAEAYEGDDPYFRALHHLRGSRPKSGLEFVDRALERLLASYRNDSALELMDLALPHLDGGERVKLLLRKADRLLLVGRLPDAGAAAAEAHELAAAAGDEPLVLKALLAWSSVLARIGDLDRAEELARESLDLARRVGDRSLEASAYTRVGTIEHMRLHYVDAIRHHEQAIEIYAELGDMAAEADALTGKGNALGALRRLPEAVECHQRVLDTARRVGNRNREAGTLVNLGNTHSYAGRIDEAEKHYQQAREILAEIGNRSWEATAISNISLCRGRRGELEAVLEMRLRILALREESGARGDVCHALVSLIPLNLTLGRLDRAKELQGRASELGRELGEPWASRVLYANARIAAEDGDSETAERLFRELAKGDTEHSLDARLGLVRLGLEEAGTLLEATVPMEASEAQVLVFAFLGDQDATRAALEKHGARLGVAGRMEVHFLLGDVAKAWELLCHLRDHAPEDCRESILENVPLHREIMEAARKEGLG